MFCNQCEQAAKGIGCSTIGVCGKTPDVASLQDLLIHCMKGLALVAAEGRRVGIVDADLDRFTMKAIFSTLTNVDFDPQRFVSLIEEAESRKEELKGRVAAKGGKIRFSGEPEPSGIKKIVSMLFGSEPAKIDFFKDPSGSLEKFGVNELVEGGDKVGFDPTGGIDPDINSLKQILLYGLKGLAAYGDHAAILGREDEAVAGFIYEALAAIVSNEVGLDEMVGLCLKCGEVNIRAMELLDDANTGTYGHPVPTVVPLGPKAGKAILVSGHDLKDLDILLKQTEGKGIQIYTHGEMLPCHGYPELKKYDHFYGHYGTAWQNQAKEFEAFPGSILMTTNCIQKPRDSYKDRIFTTGLVGWPGVAHVGEDKDFSPVIEKALACDGFAEDADKGTVMTGFARNAVLGVADKVIEAVKGGAIKHFFLVGGCDGAKPGRNYYTELVEEIPKDCVVLTLACGKFRFFDKDLGDIGGIPRLLDVGQCNDAYSAVKIAMALADAFECGVNDLPLSLVLSWYEQKAVVILLSLLSLGIRDIRLGPTLPAFITPNVLNVLVENFNIMPIKTVQEDLEAILG
ncbi:MAG: hydroxylamine reductase [Desulfobacterales bacterium]|nr:hydroxylamine reductase [Desulfobacterales bacterium]